METGQLELLTPSFELTNEEEAVLRVLNQCRGKERAVRVDDLAQRTSINSREVRAIVSHLRRDHRIRIGSSVKKPFGYYMITCPEEAKETADQLWSRAIDLLKTIQVIERRQLPEIEGQIRMRMDE